MDADLLKVVEQVGLAVPGARASGDVRPLEEVERDYLLAVVMANDGNKVQVTVPLEVRLVA